MTSSEYFIGIDIGTTGTKAAIFDLEGNQLATAYEESKLYYPRVGWVEQKPEDFYTSSINTVREIVKKSGVDPKNVISIAFSGQMAGILAIDKNWNPVIPYDSWLDIRCKSYVDQLREKYADLLIEVTGVPPTINHLPKAIWWKNERPEVFERIYKFTVPAVYAAGKFAGLSGEEAFYDYTYITYTGLFDVRKMKWSDELCETFGIPLDKLPRIVKPWEIIGELQESVAEKCGLVKGIPIVAGAGDFTASCLGAGLTKAGLCLDVAGTASVFAATTGEVIPDKEHRTIVYAKSVVPELWIAHAYVSGGGLCLRWFRDNIAKHEKNLAKEVGKDPYQLLDEAASKVTEGSEGIFFIPHLGGSVCPYNPRLRGVWLGLSWKHDTSHMYRAILESIAYEYYHFARIIKSLFKEIKLSEVRAVGGGSKSPLWCQIKADVLDIPYVLLNREEYGVLALAAIGGYAVGALKDYIQTINNWVKPVKKIEPRKSSHRKYQQYAEFYGEFLARIDELFRKHEELFKSA